MNAKEYIETFFDEKEVPIEVWAITDDDGTFHIISSDVVIEFLKTLDGKDAEKVRDTLVMIDFNNGDVNHFLKFVAKYITNPEAITFS